VREVFIGNENMTYTVTRSRIPLSYEREGLRLQNRRGPTFT